MSKASASTSSATDVTDSNRLGILVEEAEHLQSQEHISWGQDRVYKRHICRAAILGDWLMASSYDETHPAWVCVPLTEDGDTALHIAVSMEQTSFVKKLVQHASMQDMEILKVDGNSAFCMAAISGNVEIATILLHKNPRLVWIRGYKNKLPIELASSAGQSHMVKFLFERFQEDMHINLSLQDVVRLFFLAVINSTYDVASILLDTYPELTSAENDKGLTALEVLAQLSFDRDAPGYRDILSSLFKLMEVEEFPNYARTSNAMFDAAKSGNDMLLEFIFWYNPNLFVRVNSNGQTLLHIAILYRQLIVYRLILSKGAYKNVIVQAVDYEGNNVLHSAGELAAEGRFGSPIHQVLVCSEELWFKEVEKIVPPVFKTMENAKGWTPQELFYKEHRELSEKAISELNEMTNNFLVIGTLIVTLGITGALTIRTNNIQAQTPIFQQNTWYIIFLLSVAFGLSFTSVSMLLFTSVLLPSIWKQKCGYVNSRVIRMTCGCLLLYVAVGLMGTISIISGAVLVYTFFPKWIFYVVAALGGIPLMLSFVIYYYSLQFSWHVMLAFCEEAEVRMFPRMGIKKAPF